MVDIDFIEVSKSSRAAYCVYCESAPVNVTVRNHVCDKCREGMGSGVCAKCHRTFKDCDLAATWESVQCEKPVWLCTECERSE